jgi:FxsC-like protein
MLSPPQEGAGRTLGWPILEAPVSSSREARPYFYLSYARTPKRDPASRDDPDRWVYKLYKDLCAAILQMTDVPPEGAGFMDRENQAGNEWSRELTNALATCRVFVPLYSRRYFDSDNCGKEWFAFARREFNQRARGRQVASAIVPALWARLDSDRIPEVARSLQYSHDELGQRYCTEGFYGIIKLHNYRTAYNLAVYRLAERIIAIGDECAAYGDDGVAYEMARENFESLQSAFGPNSARRTTNGQLQISVLAHDLSTLPPGRAKDYYGDTPHTWSPYRPDYLQPVADYALALAEKCLDVRPRVTTIEDGTPDWPANDLAVPPGLCLIDPWVATSEAHYDRLKRLNQVEEPWVSVLVPWNSQDRELRAAEHDLREKLRQQLDRKLASVPRRCQMAASGIPTLQDFGQILPEMTMMMLKRFRKGAPAHPPVGPVITRPRLRAAGTESSGDSQWAR